MTKLRVLALALTVATGLSGLVYEVVWQRYLAILLGSHSEATASVLAIFLGGLAAGYALFGVASRRLAAHGGPRRLLLVYAGVEAAIGLYALVFPLLFFAARAISVRLPGAAGPVGFGLDVALCALLIGPPAIGMGATIPVLTQALSRGVADSTRLHARVYALNTLGAFVGALAAGFWWIDALGLVGVLVAMAVVNLLAGGGFVALALRVPPGADVPARSGPEPVSVRDGEGDGGAHAPARFTLAGVAFATGFAMMTLQTTWIRLGGLALGASDLTFAMVVAVFVLCIAIGSLGVSMLGSIPRPVLPAVLWLLAFALGGLYLQAPDSGYWAHALRSLLIQDSAVFYPYHGFLLVGLLAALGLPVALSGAVLPLLFHSLRRAHGELGGVAGGLYAWNTLGSLAGALLGGYALLFWLDLDQVFRVAIAAVVAAAGLASFSALTDRARGTVVASGVAAAVGIACVAIALLPAWSPARLSAGLFRMNGANVATFGGPETFFESVDLGEIRFYRDDPMLSVAVKAVAENVRGEPDLTLVTNGKADGSAVGDYLTQALLGLLPALFAEHNERAFVIGLGTGVTAGVLAALEPMREVVVAEISPGVVAAAPLFEHASQRVLESSKVRLVVADAHRALERAQGRFDIIVSEPSNPWVSGVEMLYSREFLEASRSRLRAGGAHVQWLHTYEIDTPTIELILATYVSVFDHVSVWYTVESDLLVVGLLDEERALDLDALARRASRPDFAEQLRLAGIDGFAQLVAHELWPVGVAHAAGLDSEPHTLLRPRLGHSAGRAFFAGRNARLPFSSGPAAAEIGAEHSLVRRWALRGGGSLADDVWEPLVSETCRYQVGPCLALLARWSLEAPSSEVRARVIEALQRRGLALEAVSDLILLQSLDQLPDQIGDPLAASRLATTAYERYSHHAAPLSRAVLVRLWWECAQRPDLAEVCRQERALIEERLGPLD